MDTSLVSDLHELNLNAKTEVNEENEEVAIQPLIDRCRKLHEEVELYIAAVDAKQKDTKLPSYQVEYRSLRNDFKNELAFLTKLNNADISAEKARHYAVSSNLLYYEALWAAAKRSTGLLSFRKYFFWNRQKEGHRTKGLSLAKGGQTKGKTAALVDIVANDGTEWIRVSTISEKRMLFDLAKLGWQCDSDSDDASGAPSQNLEDEDDEDEISIVKYARELARAARANPVRGRPPCLKMVLTRIESSRMKEIDAILDKIRQTGVMVQCANEIPETLPLQLVLPNLLVDRSRALSETLNIDCTILLALVSDISHAECPIKDWYPREVRAQIQEEAAEKLLLTHLYPAISSHPMVCTREAADQMNLIVDTLATDKEKVRANLLLAQRGHEDLPPEERLEKWIQLSDHPVPDGFQLPIQIVTSHLDAIIDTLPAVAKQLATELRPLNSAIFFYGWAEGLTTLSSNRARARQIEHAINDYGLEDGEAGPHIWLCGESRSLIAKQGRRR